MKNLKDQLNKELDAMMPPMGERIKRQPIITKAPVGEEKKKSKKTGQSRPRKRIISYIASFSAAAAIILCVLLGAFFLPAAVPPEPYGSVVLEINPAVSFVVGAENRVSKVSSLNREADILLSDETFYNSLTGVPVETSVELFTAKAKDAGYLTDGKTVNLSVVTNHEKNTQLLLQTLKKEFNEYLSQSDVTATLNAVAADVGALSKRLEVAVTEDFAAFMQGLEALPTYTFESGIASLDAEALARLYEERVSHGLYKDLVIALLENSYERAQKVDAMSALNDEIRRHEDNPALIAKDYWSLQEIYKNAQKTAELQAKLDAMSALIAEYDRLYGRKIESYADFVAEVAVYSGLFPLFGQIQGWLTELTDELFDGIAQDILSLLPEDFLGVTEELKTLQNAGMPKTKEEYLSQTKEAYRLYATYLTGRARA